MIKAIPTRYAGINFRSKLEAKWAMFFDLMGWSWTYEPEIYNGWIPDFIIYSNEFPIYVEIKPLSWTGDFPSEEKIEKEVMRDVISSGVEKVLLLGNSPKINKRKSESVKLGWFYDKNDNRIHSFEPVSLGCWNGNNNNIDYNIGFCYSNFANSIDLMNNYKDNKIGGDLSCSTIINSAWATCTNRVQWYPNVSVGERVFNKVYSRIRSGRIGITKRGRLA